MSFTAIAKDLLIQLMGTRVATWIQAVRFVWLLRRELAEREIVILPFLLRAGEVAIDVGANGAGWTSAMARTVGAAGRVYAFEADPYYAEATKKTIQLLGLRQVELHEYGLSDSDEELHLLVRDTHAHRVSGTGRVVRSRAPEHTGRTVAVTLRRLDSLLNSHPRLREVVFIKCDVEGFELMVFRGAAELIDHARPFVLAEVGHSRLHGHDDRDLYDFFLERDYRSFQLDAATSSLVPDEVAREQLLRVHNCLFVPQEKLSDLLLAVSRLSATDPQP